MRRGNHRGADKVALRRVAKAVRHELGSRVERQLTKALVVAKDIKLRGKRAKFLVEEPLLEAEVQLDRFRVALVNRSFQLQMKKKMIVSEIAGQPIGMTTWRSRPK